jgi:hypothetical protein
MNKMQPDCEDYHMLSVYQEVPGCCLTCPDARPGCLCFECNCKKCLWYSAPEEWEEKGKCDLVPILKERGKKQARLKYLISAFLEQKKRIKLAHQDFQRAEEVKKNGGVQSWYSCQSCQKNFLIEEKKELEVKQDCFPICDVCSSKIELTEEEQSEVIKEATKYLEEEDGRK